MLQTSQVRWVHGQRGAGRAVLVMLVMLVMLGTACSRSRPVDRAAASGPRERGVPSALDVVRLYRQVGLFAESTPIPFVGTTHVLATGTPDTTLVLLTLSLPNRALTFAREGDRYRGAYDVVIGARQGAASVAQTQGRQTVRVASYKETSRGDESLIFQQYLRLAPGAYTLTLTVRDAESGRTGNRDVGITVPRVSMGLSSAIPIHQAEVRSRRDTLPVIVPNPRATGIFGQDSAMRVYVEQYAASGPLQYIVRDAQGTTTWRDSMPLTRSASMASGVVTLPITRIGPGLATFAAWTSGQPDTARTPLVVSFGDGLAITSFDEMLAYLRYFALPENLSALRNATPAARGAAWLAFLRGTDPQPATPEHEGLRDYFVRVEQANLRYREEGIPGWTTDRGRVFVTLGDPDQIYEQGQGDISQRGRVQVWEYAQYRAQLVFLDQSGFGRYRLTSSSESEFQSLMRRARQR